MHITHEKIVGQSIQEMTVAGVEATDVLQAELLAERFMNRVARSGEKVVSCDRWEKTFQNGNIYTIKFF